MDHSSRENHTHVAPRPLAKRTRHQATRAALAAFLSVGAVGFVAGCSVTSGQETSGQYVDDATLTTKVKSALASEGSVTLANKVGVETGKGVVQLSGFVSSSTDRAKAEDIAMSVEGVKGVKNDIVVQ